MNNYTKDVSVARQWDIIVQVTRFGEYEQVVQLVKDGYAVTLELLELLYRVGAQHLFAQIMPYDKDLFKKSFSNSAKMNVLKKALGDKAATDLCQKIISEAQKQQDEKKKQERQRLEARLDELHQSFGLSDSFFESIISSEELMTVVLEKYDRDTVINGLKKFPTGKGFLESHLTLKECAQYGFYAIFFARIVAFCSDEERKDMLLFLTQTEDGFAALVDRAYTFIFVRDDAMFIFKDDAFTDRLKAYGNKGYYLLELAGKLTEEDFEAWCKINPEVVVFYKQFNKNIFWVIKNGYFKYLRR
ncbi:MAG: hypothetical protein IJ019_02770 [Alphaproteobacteria bacterium]|nr:hypothetical protein [Alphaproteobacteria bacterium]